MKLASQMPSSTSLTPSFWPASTVEMLNAFRPACTIPSYRASISIASSVSALGAPMMTQSNSITAAGVASAT
ncbi:MAG: hypothetical protein JWP25_3749 [Bradyrhizobium sp.]|jgi:hypothetical protein|nr:hypothetical protein [Bradyrhizobium sp.]MEA2867978.1 hypothetical protein [Bradyrhizobium sp.]